MVINLGMWLERFVIVVISLTRDFMPSAWGTLLGDFGTTRLSSARWDCFTMLLFLFVRLLPAISIAEMRNWWHETSEDRE